MPTAPRLRARQAAFAVRTVASEVPRIRRVAAEATPFATRLRVAAAELGVVFDTRDVAKVERVRPSRGQRFPGTINIPGLSGELGQKEEIANRAIEEALRWSEDPMTL